MVHQFSLTVQGPGGYGSTVHGSGERPRVLVVKRSSSANDYVPLP